MPKNISESSETSDTKATFTKLIDDGKSEIRYIYHISDIHIRNTQRHDEYRNVFGRLYAKLKLLVGKNRRQSMIVLTGDIMHTKTELSPEAISIAYHFFKELNEIATVILIPGNHDCNLSNKSRLDALTPIVEEIGKLDSFYYLKNSGIYQYQNIVFGVTSVFDTRLVSAKMIPVDIWSSIKRKYKFKIALYHGPVHGAKTDVGYRMNLDQLLVEDFHGYDYVMLGDIHKFQYMNRKETIAYSGSLIQQSHGESLKHHGILKWDLFDSESEFIEIRNDYGFVTIHIKDGQMIPMQKIPKKPRIRFILENTNQIQYQEILSKLEQEYQICEVVKESNFRISPTLFSNKKSGNDAINSNLNSNSNSNLNTDTNADNITNSITNLNLNQFDIVKNYLEQKGYTKDEIFRLIKLHAEIHQKSNKQISSSNSFVSSNDGQRWKLLELRFTNTFSYGKDNVIDFRTYEPNKIIGIMAPNRYGKSAILDIILFCLFDKFSRAERRDILHKNEKSMYCSLLLSIGSQQYLIERIGQRSKNGLTVKIDVNFSLINNNKGKITKENLNGIDKNETNRKITELVGNYNDYLTTCIFLQRDRNYNFIDMTQLQKKEYLNEILKLNIFDNCYNFSKDKLKTLTNQLNALEFSIKNLNIDRIKSNIKNTNFKLKSMILQKKMLIDSLQSELELIIESLSDNPKPLYNSLSCYDLSSDSKILKSINDVKIKITSLTNELTAANCTQNNISALKTKLLKLEETDRIENDTHNIQSLIKEKDPLSKKIIAIPKNLDQNSDQKIIQTIVNDKETATNRIDAIDQLLTNYHSSNTNDKIKRIDELKEERINLRRSIKSIDVNTETKLFKLLTESSQYQKEIISRSDDLFNVEQNITDEEKKILGVIISTKKSFSNHVQRLNQLLTNSDQNPTIAKAIHINNKWLANYEKWTKNADEILSDKQSNTNELFSLTENSTKNKYLLLDTAIDYFTIDDNKKIEQHILSIESELDALSEFKKTKQEFDNLQNEKTNLLEKVKMLNQKINDAEYYFSHVESNKKLRDKIDAIQTEIDSRLKLQNERSVKIRAIRNSIAAIDQVNDKLMEVKKYTSDLKLLEEYDSLKKMDNN